MDKFNCLTHIDTGDFVTADYNITVRRMVKFLNKGYQYDDLCVVDNKCDAVFEFQMRSTDIPIYFGAKSNQIEP